MVTCERVTVYANLPGLRALSRWLAWSAKSQASRHYQCHPAWDMGTDGASVGSGQVSLPRGHQEEQCHIERRRPFKAIRSFSGNASPFNQGMTVLLAFAAARLASTRATASRWITQAGPVKVTRAGGKADIHVEQDGRSIAFRDVHAFVCTCGPTCSVLCCGRPFPRARRGMCGLSHGSRRRRQRAPSQDAPRPRR